jgi:hypothetical protein
MVATGRTSMKLRMAALTALVGILSAFALPMNAANAQIAVPISGQCQLPSGEAGTFTGTLDVERFVARQGQLFAVVSGTVTCVGSVTGQTVTRTFESVRIPVNLGQSSGTCEILDLTLGPLHLDLLGLIVDLNQVHLRITAEQGEGNLLGNLLCAVAGLLDNQAATPNALARLLNRILGLLG